MLLYKYYSPKQHNFNALREQKFWFASNKLLNDPYDLNSGKAILDFHTTKTINIRQRIKTVCSMVTAPDKVVDLYIAFCKEVEQYASCSFSTNPIDRLMWAHYADSYNGFCLGFEVPDDKIDIHLFPQQHWHKVVYTDQMPKSLIYTTRRDVGIPINGILREEYRQETKIQNIEDSLAIKSLYECVSDFDKSLDKQAATNYVIQMLCIKAQEWVYEQEIRLIVGIKSNQNGELVSWGHDITLQEIILGSGFDKNNEVILKDIIQNSTHAQNARVTKLALNNHQYFALNRYSYKL